MAVLTFKDIHEKLTPELQKILTEKREELRDMRFKVSNDQMKDVHQIGERRQEIARILTRLNQLRDKQK